MSTFQENPAWTDKLIREHWRKLEDTVGPNMMPVPVYPGGRKFKEFSVCGFYGCVFPTNTENVVFKITSDETEAQIVAILESLKDDAPVGIVKYYKMYELPDKYRKRRVFVMWREEAFSIGSLMRPLGIAQTLGHKDSQYDALAANKFSQLLGNFLDNAIKVRKFIVSKGDIKKKIQTLQSLEDFAWRHHSDDRPFFRQPQFEGSKLAAISLLNCQQIALELENTYLADLVGNALRELLDEKILLADVHMNNIGLVERDGYKQFVITDPGHMVPLDTKWLETKIIQLYDR